MGNIHCRLVCSASSAHLSQLYTGYGMLARRGLISAEVVRGEDYKASLTAPARLTVIVNNRYRVAYDLADGRTVREDDITRSDFYFKRSFDPAYVAGHEQGHKIFPLGLNYPVTGFNDYARRRALWSLRDGLSSSIADVRDTAITFVRSSKMLSRLTRATNGRDTSWFENFEGIPDVSLPPRILLLTRTWDAHRAREKPEKFEELQHINTMRAECIRRLRKEFGARFLGGFAPSESALRDYKDCVIDNPAITRRDNYLRLVKEFSICVATMGLRRSNGWRLGEYVAGARAILSEQLYYTVPGDFRKEKNYLEFTTPDECVANAVKLMDDPSRRYEMMKRNYDYYHAYLRPDVLVWNSLQLVLMSSTVLQGQDFRFRTCFQ